MADFKALLDDPDFLDLPESEQDSIVSGIQGQQPKSDFNVLGIAKDTVLDPNFPLKAATGQASTDILENIRSGGRDFILDEMNIPKDSKKRAGIGFGIDVASSLAPDLAAGAAKGISRSVMRPLQKTGESLASRLINQLIKPGKAAFNFGRNPGLEVAKQGITATSREGLEKNIGSKIRDLTGSLNKKYSASGDKPVNVSRVLKPLIETSLNMEGLPRTTASMRSDVSDLGNDLLEAVGGDPRSVPASRVLGIKRLLGKIPSWAANDPKYGTKTDVARKAYRELDSVLDESIPETKELNSAISNLIGAKDAMSGGVAREQNRAFAGLYDRVGPAGIGGVAGTATGGVPGGIIGALAALGLSKFLSSTPMRTGAAKNIYNLSKIPAKASETLEKIEGPNVAGKMSIKMRDLIRSKNRSLAVKK
jgi:hypothetical protein